MQHREDMTQKDYIFILFKLVDLKNSEKLDFMLKPKFVQLKELQAKLK